MNELFVKIIEMSLAYESFDLPYDLESTVIHQPKFHPEVIQDQFLMKIDINFEQSLKLTDER